MSDAPSTSMSTSKGSPPGPSNPLSTIIETQPSEASLTMAQLKKIAKQLPPKPKPPQHTFTYADTDTLPNELNEFFNFAETPQSLELKDLFTKAYDDSWVKSPNSERMTYIEYLLEQLELKDVSTRVHAAKLLVYIAEGTFGECTNAEQHQHWLENNTRALRKAGALSACFQALRLSCSEHDRFNSSGPEKYNEADPLQTCKAEELCTEISYYMTILYMCIEVSRWKDPERIGVEVTKLMPSFPEFLFGLIAGLREKNVKQFPVKKLLLLLWKVILVMFGPTSGPLYIKLKNTARALNNLPPLPDDLVGQQTTKANPIDFLTFYSETAQKYPAYNPGEHPFPVSIDNVNYLKPASQNGALNGVSSSAQQPQPIAPPKRQTASAQYQTNNRQPFVFPLQKFGESVPHSILEASELYERNMYVGLGTWQLYKERSRMARNHISTDFPDNDPIPTEKVDPKASEILKNIDTLYTAILPNLQSIIVVLLKLLLSTIPNPATTAPPVAPAVPQSTNDSSTVQTQPQSPAQVDVVRNREITSKAVSALLLILLKYFRASHILRFEYLCQVLVDSGCLLLVLKLLGLQDVNGVVAGNDIDGAEGHLGWFEAVRAMPNKVAVPGSENNVNENNGISAEAVESTGTGNAVPGPQQPPHQEGVITLKTCWRNMFWSINFLRILQKLSKKKVHRIMLLVQYKSSAILKRILKISQPLLELYTLKVLKSQIPYLGRKWRTNNMKVFTSIYMRCRPDLRDEWVGGGDVDGEVEDALGQEQNLRQLVRFFHDRIYPGVLPPLAPNSLEKQDDTTLTGSLIPASDSAEFPPPRSSMASLESPIYLDDTPLNEYFLSNYESWLDDEVFSEPPSPKVQSRRNSFDSLNGFDGPSYKIDHNYSDEFETHINEGWDFPNASLTDAQDRFDALAKNIDWQTVDAKEVESKLWQSSSVGVRRLLEEPDEDNMPIKEDIPLRVGPETLY